MKKLNAYVVCLGLFVMFLVSSCVTIPKPTREGWAAHYEFMDSSLKVQEKESVKITLTPINDLEIHNYPELFQFHHENWGDDWITKRRSRGKWVKAVDFWFPPDYELNQYANTFTGMPVFLVSIQNNTGHIIRMKDARVYLIVEGEDPIPAIANVGNPTFVQTSLPLYKDNENTVIPQSAQIADGSLLDHITRYELSVVKWLIEAKASDPKKYRYYPRYPFSLLTHTVIDNHRAYKLINEVGREILPDFALNGILCFPILLEPETQARLIFYDITTQTDPAGNPTKKTQFEFSFKYEPKYVAFNQLARKWEILKAPEISKK